MIHCYHPKNTPIQAIQYTGNNSIEIINFAGDHYAGQMESSSSKKVPHIIITSDHGSSMLLMEGSYLTMNCMGKMNVYTEDEFEELYWTDEDENFCNKGY